MAVAGGHLLITRMDFSSIDIDLAKKQVVLVVLGASPSAHGLDLGPSNFP